jgi:hypothetical protein
MLTCDAATLLYTCNEQGGSRDWNRDESTKEEGQGLWTTTLKKFAVLGNPELEEVLAALYGCGPAGVSTALLKKPYTSG